MAKETTTSETQFDEAITKLERALLAPLVPGELVAWSKNVQQTADELGCCLQEYVPNTLHAQYKEIAQNDPDLLRRVEQMRAEDVQLLEEFKTFQKRVVELVMLADSATHNERKADDYRTALEQQGTAIMLAFKKHQIAMNTWRTESIVRDTGVAD